MSLWRRWPLLLLVVQFPLVAGAQVAQARHADFNGIWSAEQGVLWDPAVRNGQRQNPPFTPAYAAKYQKALDAAARGRPIADRTTDCLPAGVPRILASPFPFELVVAADTVYFLFEYQSQVRRVYTGKDAPPRLGVPTYNGHSTGFWKGDELTIDTVDLYGDSVLDTTGVPHSGALRVHERLRLIGPDRLEIVITLHDPEAYVVPWTVTRTYTRTAGERILEYACAENNRNAANADGTTGFQGAGESVEAR